MKNKVLIAISGIGEECYAIEDVKSFKELSNEYLNIISYDYQSDFDKYTFPGSLSRKYLDPVRLKFNVFKSRYVVNGLDKLIKKYKKQGYTVDIIAHSLGTWISYKVKETVNKVIFVGSPVGWRTACLRFVVRQDICTFWWTKPSLKCKEFINLYSCNDFVGNKKLPKKWEIGCQSNRQINTFTNHDLIEYLKVYMEIIKNEN